MDDFEIDLFTICLFIYANSDICQKALIKSLIEFLDDVIVKIYPFLNKLR